MEGQCEQLRGLVLGLGILRLCQWLVLDGRASLLVQQPAHGQHGSEYRRARRKKKRDV
jgi:hypothetical protein